MAPTGEDMEVSIPVYVFLPMLFLSGLQIFHMSKALGCACCPAAVASFGDVLETRANQVIAAVKKGPASSVPSSPV